jgi:chemotaxis protein CheX
MNSSESPLDSSFSLEEVVHRVLPRVLFTMLDLEAAPVDAGGLGLGEQVTAVIGIGGEGIEGSLYFHLPEALALRVGQLLLEEALGRAVVDREVNDAVGELCNMIAGGLKAALLSHGVDTALSPPSVIRGKNFSIAPQENAKVRHFLFECEGHVMDLEVHLNF